MSEMINVTVSLPVHLVREARHRAIDRGTSLSRFIATTLEESIARNATYAEARTSQEQTWKRGLEFGSQGKISWTRDELHHR